MICSCFGSGSSFLFSEPGHTVSAHLIQQAVAYPRHKTTVPPIAAFHFHLGPFAPTGKLDIVDFAHRIQGSKVRFAAQRLLSVNLMLDNDNVSVQGIMKKEIRKFELAFISVACHG